MAQIYISYAKEQAEDARFANHMRQWLLDNGHQPWLDPYDIPPGVARDTAVANALRDCEIVLGLVSAASVQSTPTKDEWGYAIEKGKLQLVKLQEAKISHRFIRLNIIDLSSGSADAWEQLKAVLESPSQAMARNQHVRQSTSVATENPFDQFLEVLNQNLKNLNLQNWQQKLSGTRPTPKPFAPLTPQPPSTVPFGGQHPQTRKGIWQNPGVWVGVGVLVGSLCICSFFCSLLN
jgi:hypothetical protein